MVIDIEGKPRGKGRPRFGQGRTYTDKNTREYERLVADTALAEMQRSGQKTMQGAVKILILAYFPIPKSTPKKRVGELLRSEPLLKPDADNISKIILDGLQQSGIYADDKQVTYVAVRKRYAAEPHVKVFIKEKKQWDENG